ncbi:hypothetical protein E2C01_040098 [Portunus trituberculatus]|uniref:Uncharacterized protein n=1 Tax=Portunus trituberculatus TaxID=210409 RepID=A0A5B7FN20_PORTR|nr:hypothetical protein [Portunus trituberculatus]
MVAMLSLRQDTKLFIPSVFSPNKAQGPRQRRRARRLSHCNPTEPSRGRVTKVHKEETKSRTSCEGDGLLGCVVPAAPLTPPLPFYEGHANAPKHTLGISLPIDSGDASPG